MTTRDDAILVGTPDFKADAHARYAELRERGPIHRVRSADGSAVWLVVEYELGREALAHPKLSKDPEPFAERLRAAGQHIMLAGSGFGGNMLTADPPSTPGCAAWSPRRSPRAPPNGSPRASSSSPTGSWTPSPPTAGPTWSPRSPGRCRWR
ncbi:hypothetical protein ACFQQB_09945 [Nonomuraea rubra]|uniref:hypothetical protein n=1 Tax=Nonomuraea rubra TaxID=46180 RepID=UPI00360C36D4